MLKYIIFMMIFGHGVYAAPAEGLNGFDGQWRGVCKDQEYTTDPFPMDLAFRSGKEFSMEYEGRIIRLGVPLPYFHKGEDGDEDVSGNMLLVFDQGGSLNLYVVSEQSPENQVKWNMTVNESQMRVRINQFLRFRDHFTRELITDCVLDKTS